MLLPAEAGTVNAIGCMGLLLQHGRTNTRTSIDKDKSSSMKKAFPESGEYDMDAYFSVY